MLAEIITIGDEILIGQIVDTNSAWMAAQLNDAGIRIKQIFKKLCFVFQTLHNCFNIS